VKWKLEIEMKLLEKNGIRIEIEIIFKMEITLAVTDVTMSFSAGEKKKCACQSSVFISL